MMDVWPKLVKPRGFAPAGPCKRPDPKDRSMRTDRQAHWRTVFAAKQPDQVSWYQPEPTPSLKLIEATGIGREASIVDVGGGTSTLVDHLIDLGFQKLTVLDVADNALEVALARLEKR